MALNLAALNHCARHIREEGRSLPDWYIRHVCGHPPAGELAQINARQSALLLEEDREACRDE